MKISILTLFPEIFPPVLNSSIIGRAQKKGLVEIEYINIREFGIGSHQVVDDTSYGGGVGMVLKPDVLAAALKSVQTKDSWVVLTSAAGKTYNQSKAKEYKEKSHLILVCGHYEGVDQRFIDKYVDEEISIGDYILTGGEIASMVITDSVVRLIKGVLAKEQATSEESFELHKIDQTKLPLLEYPHYTRPEEFEGEKVPNELLSGNHKKITEWRFQRAYQKTQKVRADLLLKRNTPD